MGRAQCLCIGAGTTAFGTQCLVELGDCLRVLGINPDNNLNYYLVNENVHFCSNPSDFW